MEEICEILTEYVKEKHISYEIIKRVNYLNFIDENNNDWDYISTLDLEDDFIQLYNHKLNWNVISTSNKTEDFLRKYDNFINFYLIGKWQKLSDQFIYDYKDKLDFFDVSTYQQMSENLMDAIPTYLFWEKISERQILSENFIRKYLDFINPSSILMCQKIYNYSTDLIDLLKSKSIDYDSDFDIYMELV